MRESGETEKTYICQSNRSVIDGFTQYLQNKGLKFETTSRHVENIVEFACNYLCSIDFQSLTNLTANAVRVYLGTWYIQHWFNCSKKDIHQNLVAFKKFSKYLQIKKIISAELRREIYETCKDKDYFLRRLTEYNSLPWFTKHYDEALKEWLFKGFDLSEDELLKKLEDFKKVEINEKLCAFENASSREQFSQKNQNMDWRPSESKAADVGKVEAKGGSSSEGIGLIFFKNYLAEAQGKSLAKKAYKPVSLQRSLTALEMEAYGILSGEILKYKFITGTPSKNMYYELKTIALVINRYELNLVLLALAVHYKEWQKGGMVDQLFHLCQADEAYGEWTILLYDYALAKANRWQERIDFAEKAIQFNPDLTVYLTCALISTKMQLSQWFDAYRIYDKSNCKELLDKSMLSVLTLNLQRLEDQQKPIQYRIFNSVPFWETFGHRLLLEMNDQLYRKQHFYFLRRS